MNGYGQRGGIGSNLPPIFKGILIINVSVLILELILSGISFGGINLGYYFHYFFSLNTISSESFLTEWYSFWPWQLVSYQFMHSLNDIFHLLFNMYILYIFGSQLEKLWGGDKFLGFYLLAGIGGGLVQLFFMDGIQIFPDGEMAIPNTVGASAAVMGTVVGLATIYPDEQVFMFPLFIPIKLKWIAIAYVVFDVIYGITGTGGNVANFAHVGGALTGFLLVKHGDRLGIFNFMSNIFDLFKRKTSYSSNKSSFSHQGANVHKMYNKEQSYKKTYKTYEETQENAKTYNIQGEEITQIKIDQILDKISETGYQNLTEREKEILIELSKHVK
ncbi:rhomboid family intramembrane serine protease [Candidatus Kapabacteria bacterium]|nr:rhomboid family intramembrane serine protease [Candidatus Kapabacteria bacterium]